MPETSNSLQKNTNQILLFTKFLLDYFWMLNHFLDFLLNIRNPSDLNWKDIVLTIKKMNVNIFKCLEFYVYHNFIPLKSYHEFFIIIIINESI